MPSRPPGVHTHEEWKGMAQPVGLVVEPVVLNRLGVFPESATTVLADWQQRLEQLLEDQPVGEQWLSVAPSFELFCQEVLAWQPGDLRKPEELAAPVAVHLDDYDEVLRPDWVVPEPSQGDGPLKAQLLVQELPLGTLFDALPKGTDGRRSWEATPQQRLERLLKESEHPIGLLWNGVALRLVYAPRGESSGHLTFPLEPMTTVDGRPMLAALQMLLGPDRLFEGGASNTRLRPLMEQSRKEQNEVSTRLAEQVLEALWILLRGFDAAGLEVEDSSHIYGGLITVLLRLVFLLYAEDEELMPTDSLYGQHYSVGGLAQRLRQDRSDYQNAMEGRRGAWATLLSLFRLVYDGGGSTEAYLPARHGDLFDPETYPFLEGRTADTAYTDGPLSAVPAISDDVVEQVLTKLLLLDGQILSYRALDVEQIGSVYEGIMGFMVEKAIGPSVGITHKPPRQKVTITVVVDASELLAQPASKREKWLKDATGVDLKLGDKVSKGLKTATTVEDLCHALDKRLSKHTPRGGFQSGSLILQPTEERRRSGSHYTPRSLTEPIVAEALRPWLEGCNGKPTAEQVLALKLCDPAMGSGAFLVAVCRFLARWLVAAWEDPEGPGFPPEFRKEWDKDLYARRLIAQRCLYGVDKNPFAVNLAKLSLWLVTLSKELPFTFVDHALKCGDSLVGYSVKEIQAAMKELQLGFLNQQNQIYAEMGIVRRESFSDDSRNDEAYDRKRMLLNQQIKASEGLRAAGDMMAAAFFAGSKPKERADKQEVYLAMLSGTFRDEGLRDTVQEIRQSLAAGEKGITPFHWDLEFPEVFGGERGGFDVFVGNPPFIGGSKIYGYLGESYPDWLRHIHKDSEGKGVDIVTHFFRRAETLICWAGAFSFIAQSSLSEGDSRKAGLAYLIKRKWSIYSAVSRMKWPGAASVVICNVALTKRNTGSCIWNGQVVEGINSYLMPVKKELEPIALDESANTCFVGCNLYGEGFIFSDKIEPGEPGSIQEAETILATCPNASEVIMPYIGGVEISNDPYQKAYRMAINFRDMSLAEASRFPIVLEIAKARVKPERDKIKGGYSVAETRKRNWWLYGTYTPALYRAIQKLSKVAAATYTSFYFCPSVLDTSYVFNKKVVVFAFDDKDPRFSVLSSTIHQAWVIQFGTTQGTGVTYSPKTCYQAFPMPDFASNQEVAERMVSIASSMLQLRTALMRQREISLTGFLGKVSDPFFQSDDISQYRSMQCELDQQLMLLYGWDDITPVHGFYMDSKSLSDIEDENVDESEVSDDLFSFFVDIDSCAERLSAIPSEIGGSRPPWRFGISQSIGYEIISRLVSLNLKLSKGLLRSPLSRQSPCDELFTQAELSLT